MQPDLPKGRYLVTGATGLVGRHVLARLAEAGVGPITALFHLTPPHDSDPRWQWQHANLAALDQCAAAMSGHDYVVHAAGVVAPAAAMAENPIAPMRRNLNVTGNVLEAAWRARVKRLVWFSSTTGYPGDREVLDEAVFLEGDPPPRRFAIGWAHRALEAQARAYAEHVEPRMDIVALRPSLIYGPRTVANPDRAHTVFALAHQVAHRIAPVDLRGDGGQACDLIHADDVARAACLAMTRGGRGFAAYNIASGRTVTMREVLNRLAALDHWVDPPVNATVARLFPDTPPPRLATEWAEAELGFRPEVSLDRGLAGLLTHMRDAISEERLVG